MKMVEVQAASELGLRNSDWFGCLNTKVSEITSSPLGGISVV